MKIIMPVICPICNDILVTAYIPYVNKSEILKKTCSKRLDHKLVFYSSKQDHDVLNVICWNFSDLLRAIWTFDLQTACVANGDSFLFLPFFMPDFSNIPKLKQKIKTYVVFS